MVLRRPDPSPRFRRSPSSRGWPPSPHRLGHRHLAVGGRGPAHRLIGKRAVDQARAAESDVGGQRDRTRRVGDHGRDPRRADVAGPARGDETWKLQVPAHPGSPGGGFSCRGSEGDDRGFRRKSIAGRGRRGHGWPGRGAARATDPDPCRRRLRVRSNPDRSHTEGGRGHRRAGMDRPGASWHPNPSDRGDRG